MTIITNFLAILVFASSKALHQPGHFYFFNLVVCDAFVGLISLPSRLTLDLHGCWPTSYVFCRLYKVVDWVATGEAGTTMILISWSRYRMMTLGAQYQSEDTARKVALRLIISWVINIFLYTPALFMDEFTGVSITGKNACQTEFFQHGPVMRLLITVNNIVPPVALLLIYIEVFIQLRKRQQLNRRTVAPSAAPGIKNIAIPGSAAVGEKAHHKSRSQEKALFILAFSFLLTSCPCGVLSITMFATYDDSIFAAYLWTLYLLYLSSFINTVIYTYKVPAMRRGAVKLLPRKWIVSRRRFDVETSDNGRKTHNFETTTVI